MLRDAGYYDEALYLAEHHGETEWFLAIQIENRGGLAAAAAEAASSAKAGGPSSSATAPSTAAAAPAIQDGYDTALAYIHRLPFVEAEACIRK